MVPDNVPDFAGPLAGILAGLDWLAAQDNGVEWLLSVPGDCPFLPDDLVERLHMARRKMGAGVPLACARSGEWRHPVVGLWPLALRASLRKALVEEDLRKIEVWTARHGVAVADWPAEPVDPFFNVNTPEDAERADAHCAAASRHLMRLDRARAAPISDIVASYGAYRERSRFHEGVHHRLRGGRHHRGDRRRRAQQRPGAGRQGLQPAGRACGSGA